MSNTDDLTLRMRATGGAATAREVNQGSAAVKKFGTETEKSGKSAIKAREQVRLFSGGLKSFTSFAASGALGLGLLGFGEVIRSSIKSAADLNAEVHQSNVVFGASAKSVKDWADTADTALGQTSSDALTAVSGFGALFKSLGFTTKQSADMSEKLDKVAVSLASLRNVDPSVALAALKGGVLGQTRGLKTLGIALDANQVKQKAMQMGLYSGKGAITISAKAAASYQLILEQTKGAQDDFAKRSHSLAGEQKILSAELGNVSEEVGTALLPILAKGAGGVLAFVKQIKDGKGAGGDLRIVVTKLGAAFGWAYDRVEDLVRGYKENKTWALLLGSALIGGGAAFVAFKVGMLAAAAAEGVLTAAQTALNVVLDANPIGIILLALTALGVAFYTAYTKSRTFRDGVNSIFGVVREVFNWIKGHWQLLGAILTGPFGVAALAIKNNFKSIVTFAINAVNDLIKAYDGTIGRLPVIGSHIQVALVTNPYSAKKKSTLPKPGSVATGVGPASKASPVKGHRASGGMISDPGVYEVGERGAEHVYLPANSMVEPHGGWRGGDLVLPVTLVAEKGGVPLARAILKVSMQNKATR